MRAVPPHAPKAPALRANIHGVPRAPARGVARVPNSATMRSMEVSEMNESRMNGQLQGADEHCAPTPDNGRSETLVRVGRQEFAIPCQERGWNVPGALRGVAIAELWRIVRSRRIKADVKIRAIEALVRLDAQALAEARQQDWRDVQSSNHGRSNVRILAELARQRSLPSKSRRSGKGKDESEP